VAENYFVKGLMPLKGVLEKVPFIGVGKTIITPEGIFKVCIRNKFNNFLLTVTIFYLIDFVTLLQKML
jgi:hypothetical protein